MTDKKILDLLFDRSPQGISELRDKYGGRLFQLADNLLGNRLDAEECVNDALLAAWNAIPPQRPDPLLAWLYATVRNIAMNRCRVNYAKKRGGGSFLESLEELEEVADFRNAPESAMDSKELAQALERFLRRLPYKDRALFLGRYYAGESYCSIGQRLGMTEENCQVRAFRLRKKLKIFLEKEGLY